MAPPKGFKQSLETREKIRAALLGRSKSAEMRAKLSAAQKGKLKGPKTEAQKAAHLKGMQALRGKGRPKEVRDKISASLIGHGGYTNEVRQVMSDKARVHAQLNWEGGTIGEAFASVLCPAGYVREYYLYYGKPIVYLGNGILRRHFFRLDFAHLDAQCNIELDGPGHKASIEEDRARDEILRSMGWKVIRIRYEKLDSKKFPEAR